MKTIKAYENATGQLFKSLEEAYAFSVSNCGTRMQASLTLLKRLFAKDRYELGMRRESGGPLTKARREEVRGYLNEIAAIAAEALEALNELDREKANQVKA